jgi:PAS domain S-box-containing protein
MAVLWTTDYIVADVFVSRDFLWCSQPYTEPGLGPLGPLFELYIALACIAAIVFWIRYKGTDSGYRHMYVVGMLCWIVFGLHDALASLGVPSVQYFMEYGYLGFSTAVLWVLFSSYVNASVEDKYRVITEFTSDGILFVQNGTTVFGNPAADDLFGQAVNDAKLEELVKVFIPEDRAALHRHCQKLLQAGENPDMLVLHFTKKQREEQIVEMRASLIKYRNKAAILFTMRDVTEKIQEERDLRENEQRMLRRTKMESLGLLAGGVAHDLNNVLSGIINYPELILMNLSESSSLRKPVEAIRQSGFKAVAIVQDMLTMARGAAITKQPLNLNDEIRRYLSSPEHQKLKHFHPLVKINTDLDANLFNIQGSSVHIGKVVMNLVSNASEAIEGQGEVWIRSENRYLDRMLKGYDAVTAGEYAVLTVSDTGPGICSEDLSRIFEPFFTKKVMGRSGTGLGLALVWNVMQDHEGYINVVTNEAGTTFELYFPVTREVYIDQASTLSVDALAGKGESILVVDDVESQREISCRMLEALNYQAKALDSGEAAVEYLKTHDMDLVLLDMIMDPGIDGCETYERIIKHHPGQKAIIISGFSETERVRDALKLGVDRYLKKPIVLEDLGTAVKEVLQGGLD